MPGWTLNILTPLIPNINMKHFFLGTLIGTIPYNSIVVSIGSSLNEIDSVDPLNQLFSIKFLFIFTGISVSCLIAPLIKNKKNKEYEYYYEDAITKKYHHKSVSAAYYV